MDLGVFRRGKLLETTSRSDIDEAVLDGSLIVVRHGWVATPTAHPEVVRAVGAGGVLTCLSALKHHGVWVPPTQKLHVRGSTASARDHPDWCRQHGRPPRIGDAVDDLPTALRHAAHCLSTEDFVVICDSILNRGLLTPSALEAELAGTPRAVQHALTLVDGRSESGTETMVRLRLRRQHPHLQIRPQVPIPDVGRVDLVIGTSLIIEVDGYEYHADPDQFERDRDRDLHAWSLGYDPLRLTYRQVVYQWKTVGPLIEEAIRRGAHRKILGNKSQKGHKTVRTEQ